MQSLKQFIFVLLSCCIIPVQGLLAQSPSIALQSDEPLLLRFDYTAAGNISPQRTIRFVTTQLSAPLSVTAPAGFEISKNNSTYSATLNYSTSELASVNTIYIRFKPLENNKGYGGNLSFTSGGLSLQKPDLSASSLPEHLSLDVVSWNISWLGSEYNGPANDLLQAELAMQIMDSLNADIYLIQEIVDTALLGFISRNMKNGPYDYRVSLYASNALNTQSGNWRIGQKLAFLYKKNIFSNVSTRGFTSTSTHPSNYYYWASGRYPFRMDANVQVAGKSKKVSFINLHAKAELGDPSDYSRRKGAAELMYDSLTINHADEYFLIGGDYNDDLDVTISQAVQETLTPYHSFMSDDLRYSPISFWNSKRGDNSYIGYPNVVDHAIVSTQMARDYVPFSCILRKEVTDWVPYYRYDVSDHYPMMSRFDLQQSPSNLITSVSQLIPLKESFQILQRPGSDPLIRFFSNIKGGCSIRLTAADGRIVRQESLQDIRVGSTYTLPLSGCSNGVYFVTIITSNGIFTDKIIR
jgi:hypothetical protein